MGEGEAVGVGGTVEVDEERRSPVGERAGALPVVAVELVQLDQIAAHEE